MPRYKAILEYDGGAFVGWQRQENGPSVQEAVEAALAKFCGEAVTVFAAGRTDTGVHASGQCVHFDLGREWPAAEVEGALNYHLRPAAVVALSVELAAEDFHARFGAKQRHYLYRIINRRAPLAVDLGHAWQVSATLDAAAMHEAAQHLIGRHDFTTFRAAQCQADSPERTLDRLEVTREGDEVRVVAEARSFLHNQVRSMVGTLKLVGEGKWTADQVASALAARDRAACGTVAPPEGLYLTRVVY